MSEQDELNKAAWGDDRNWTMPVGFYFSKVDTRWLVPRRQSVLGWTFNLGRPAGAWALLACFLAPIVILAGVVTLLALAAAQGRGPMY